MERCWRVGVVGGKRRETWCEDMQLRVECSREWDGVTAAMCVGVDVFLGVWV